VTTSLPDGSLDDLLAGVEAAAAEHAARYPEPPGPPGGRGGRQPVHTVYVPADRFTAATASGWGAEAGRLLDAHAPDGDALAAAVGLDDRGLAGAVRERVAAKLAREPVEDLRVDFEDGYGVRDDAEEDADAARCAGAVAEAWQRGSLPPFAGLRVKSFADGRAAATRSARTLDRFLTGLLDRAGGTLPGGLVVTFPKVVVAAHVAAFADLLGRLEAAAGLPARSLSFEVQVETTQSVLGPGGTAALPGIVDAADGRLAAAHFGVYDYSAACGLPPAEQRLDHPACDFARHVMQVTLAGTGVRLSDGSTNVVPATEGAAAVHAAWRRHADDVRHSLRHGFWQGWDLHPAHLVSRFAAVYAFHLAELDRHTARVAAFTGRGPAVQGVLDEPATIRALLGQLRRAVDCGAADEAEVADRAGLDPAALWALPGRPPDGA
jgi:citrate lyase beta subunit